MGMHCICGVKKRKDEWICKCDWEGWFLCFSIPNLENGRLKPIPIKDHPELEGTYLVRVFEDGNNFEEESEFSIVEKNWGEETNQAVSRWKVEYDDNWLGYRGVYAWKENGLT